MSPPAGQPSSSPAPDTLPEPEDEQRRDTIIQEDKAHKKEERTRGEELRTDMMRSIVTEPLLSKVQENLTGKYDVIISLNELFEGGIEAALDLVEKRAQEWNVKYATVSHYCFACLTGEQILILAQETRSSIDKHGRGAAVIYRIWEDNDISVSLTRSLTRSRRTRLNGRFGRLAKTSSGRFSIRESTGTIPTSRLPSRLSVPSTA
jgi:hypothetical protein